MQGLAADIGRYSAAGGKIDMTRFAQDYPVLAKTFGKTWGAMVEARITDPKLKAIVSSLWGYYGLPPSRLSPYYYALPTIGYLEHGGYYPKGRLAEASATPSPSASRTAAERSSSGRASRRSW